MWGLLRERGGEICNNFRIHTLQKTEGTRELGELGLEGSAHPRKSFWRLFSTNQGKPGYLRSQGRSQPHEITEDPRRGLERLRHVPPKAS